MPSRSEITPTILTIFRYKIEHLSFPVDDCSLITECSKVSIQGQQYSLTSLRDLAWAEQEGDTFHRECSNPYCVDRDHYTRVANDERICTVCKRILPLSPSYFHRSKKGKGGVISRCIDCESTSWYNKRYNSRFTPYE